MATNFNAAVHSALYDVLIGSLGGADLYDEVPFEPEGAPDNAFPYVVLGDTELSPWSTDDHQGAEVDATVHVWSRYRGRKETRDLLDTIYGLLDRASLTAAGYNFVDCLFLFSDILKEQDGKTRHGVIRFRVTIQEA